MSFTPEELIEKGIDTKDTFSTEVLESGMLAPNVAYQLSKGRGLTDRSGYRPLRFKVEVVHLDTSNHEVRRETGYSTPSEASARKFIQERTTRYTKKWEKEQA